MTTGLCRATRADVALTALGYVDTPFVHQGRLCGVGVDCVGVVIGVAKKLSLSDYDIRAYHMLPDAESMRRELMANLDPVPFADMQVGDVLWFRVETDPQHLGILVEPGIMVHASNHPIVRKVIRQRIEGYWRSRLTGVFKFRGIE